MDANLRKITVFADVDVSYSDEHFQLFFELFKPANIVFLPWNHDIQLHLAGRAAGFRSARCHRSLAAALVVVYFFVVMIVVVIVTTSTVSVLVFMIVPVRAAGSMDVFFFLVLMFMVMIAAWPVLVLAVVVRGLLLLR